MSLQPFRVRGGLDAENQLVQRIADPRPSPQGDQDAVNLRTFLAKAGIKFAARVANLPSPSDPDPSVRPADGVAYLVRSDLAGNTLNRLAVWSSSGTTTGPVAQVDVIEPPADIPAITAAAGTSDPGNAFDAGAGTGAILDFLANASGQITATIIAPGTGYAIGDSISFPASSMAFPGMTGNTKVVVTRLAGAAPTGGWQFIALKDWIKPAKADPDHLYGQEPGDLQFTTERNHEEIKVWNGTAWITLTSTDDIKAWIAALSLFEGTVKQVGGAAVPGAVELTALVNLADVTPAGAAAGLAKNSHYWTWVGQAGYTIAAADPNGVGRDLAGAIMQVGDWLQIANRGTAVAPDMHWVHIGGDLLAKSRADVLYGLNNWVAGNYEANSLTNYNGGIWRANGVVNATDLAPGVSGNRKTATVTIPFNAGTTTGRSYSVVVTYDGTAQAAKTFTIADTDSNAQALAKLRDWFTAQYPGVLFGADSTTPNSVDVTTVAVGKTLAITMTGTGLGNATVAVADTATTAPWTKINLTAGVRNVPTDADLPATAPATDVYLVLNSTIGGGKPALFAYDPGTTRWVLLGGGGGTPLKLTGGQEIRSVGVPVGTILPWLHGTPPPGWLLCDGTAFSATAYPELAAMITTGRVPDLRGAYLRGAGASAAGWGAAGNRPGASQEDSTALPKAGFGGATTTAGNHDHGLGDGNVIMTSLGGHDLSPAGGGNPEGYRVVHPDGAHAHGITVLGGDPETRPKSIFVDWIIKALDATVTLVP